MGIDFTNMFAHPMGENYFSGEYYSYMPAGSGAAAGFPLALNSNSVNSIYKYNNKYFHVCSRQNYPFGATFPNNFIGHAYVAVLHNNVDPMLMVNWHEADPQNAPEMNGGFTTPILPASADNVGQQIFLPLAWSGYISVVNVDKYLYITYWHILTHVYPVIGDPGPSSKLAIVRFDMDTETYDTPDISGNIYDSYNTLNYEAEDTIQWGDGITSHGPAYFFQSIYRKQNNTILTFANNKTIFDPTAGAKSWWTRPCYAKYIIGTGWVTAVDPIDSWVTIGVLNDRYYHDQSLIGLAISDDGICRMIMAGHTLDPDTFLYQAENMTYQTLRVTDELTPNYDTGFIVDYSTGSNKMYSNLQACGRLNFLYLTFRPPGGVGVDAVRLLSASLSGINPTFTSQVVIGPLPQFNHGNSNDNIDWVIPSRDLNTIIMVASIIPSIVIGVTQAIRYYKKSGSGYVLSTPDNVSLVSVSSFDTLPNFVPFFSLLTEPESTFLKVARGGTNDVVFNSSRGWLWSLVEIVHCGGGWHVHEV